ncbi:31813_t:CDS:1, partial [Gigaspora margarita]
LIKNTKIKNVHIIQIIIMPCHIDTIVKINQIRQTYRDESKLTLYAIGAYPIKSEDCELELVLFVPINKEEKDSNTQSIFEKN